MKLLGTTSCLVSGCVYLALTITVCTASLIFALLLLCSEPSGSPRDFSTARRTLIFTPEPPLRKGSFGGVGNMVRRYCWAVYYRFQTRPTKRFWSRSARCMMRTTKITGSVDDDGDEETDSHKPNRQPNDATLLSIWSTIPRTFCQLFTRQSRSSGADRCVPDVTVPSGLTKHLGKYQHYASTPY